VAMGGEWGIGASLTMETARPESRGLVSGILQVGYPSGFLLASIAYYLLFPHFGWRGLFMAGLLPALLVFYIRRNVAESPGWNHERAKTTRILEVLGRHWQLAIYAILLMTALNLLSHGTQDLYPTFLKVDHGFDPQQISATVIAANIGAILGSLLFGTVSQRLGRRRMLVIGGLFCLPIVPVWAFSQDALLLAAGGFVMQFMVQGCWAVVPAHLNELSPGDARGTFPGVVYQLGNLFASYNGRLQPQLAIVYGSYGFALAAVGGVAALATAIFASMGKEAKDSDMHAPAAA
jgi:MFS transporter, SHS family, lactate transporter